MAWEHLIKKTEAKKGNVKGKGKKKTGRLFLDLLLGGLAKVTLGSVELGLEEGDLAGKALAHSLGGLALVQVQLCLGNSVLGLLELTLDQDQLVLQ